MEDTGIGNTDAAWLVEPDNIEGVKVERALLSLHDSKVSNVTVSNTTGYTQMLEPHNRLGSAVQCSEVLPLQQLNYKQTTEMPAVVQKITTQEKLDWRKSQLRMLVDREDSSA